MVSQRILSLCKKMLENDIHCFFHDTDKYTLTSRNYIWAFPGIDGENTIAGKPEGKNLNLKKFSGICSDNKLTTND